MSMSDFLLTDKVAIVTGGSRGLGEAMALGFAEAGANVAICSRNMTDLEKVAQKIASLGRKALPVATDITRRGDIQRLVAETLKKFGRIDILVNNAAMVSLGETLLQTKEEDWDKVIEADLKSVYMCSQEVASVMVRQKKGSIVNMTSGLAFRAKLQRGMYSVAKAGVATLTYHLALELGPSNVRANCIAPSFIKTQATQSLLKDPDYARRIQMDTPLGRIGETKDCVGAAIFLASDASSFITGQVIFVDGGRHVM